MSDAFVIWPAARGLIRIEGPDARPFLQGIVSNDVGKASPARAIYAAFLTPQGKYLHDFFIAEREGALWLDCEAARADDLLRRLARFKLRSKVTVAMAPAGEKVALVYGAGALARLGLPPERGAARPFAGGIAYADPRLAAMGARAMLPAGAESELAGLGIAPGNPADYEKLRLVNGVPDGSRDLEVEKSILLENGFDELAGVDWDKGCYMGQELTARTHYRALIKKRLVPVAVAGAPPPPGTPVLADGSEVGVMRSADGTLGLALLRIDAIEAAVPLSAGAATLRPMKPAWMKIAG